MGKLPASIAARIADTLHCDPCALPDALASFQRRHRLLVGLAAYGVRLGDLDRLVGASNVPSRLDNTVATFDRDAIYEVFLAALQDD